MRKLQLIILLMLVLGSLNCYSGECDSVAPGLLGGRWGGALRVMPGRQVPLDQYSRQWIHGKNTFTVAAELTNTTVPADGDDYAADYGYPTLGLGVAYDFNHGITMHRYPSPSWGKAQEVDYHSVLGNALSLYVSFARPVVRSRHWEAAYVLRGGIGLNSHYYNNTDAIDNELIGSFATIYFGAALMVSWHITPEWAITGSMEYRHHSNGALYRPNKGENTVGPAVGIVYSPAYRDILDARTSGNSASRSAHRSPQAGTSRAAFPKYWFFDITAGLGGKTLLEDWQLTQFRTDPADPDYRTEHFRLHPAYSLQTAFMRRYARRWATGIGADLFYGSYYKRIRQLENANGHADEAERVSPWSVGVALKHNAYYHRLSLNMSVGVYLFRQMGSSAKVIEKPYYERIGLHYTFPRLGGLHVGVSLNAHLTKADFTELVVGLPLRLR